MVLQLHPVDRRWMDARRRAADFPPTWATMAELGAVAEAEVGALRAARLAADGPVTRLRARFDAAVRTDATEWMDRDSLPPAERTEMVRRLHRFNRALFSYHRFVRFLRPVIDAVAAREGRPARLLELASGSGELALALDRLATRRGLPVELTGSDIVQSHVDSANQRAEAGGHRVRFRRVDAMDLLAAVTPGAFDIICIAQAAHHFSPGFLARMIAQARVAGARHFVVIDGRRNLSTLAFLVPLAGALTRHRKLMYDAYITARKFYADAELELLARVAAPGADVAVQPHEPGFVTLTVRF